ncbi:hypothetical protein [uncultured Nostoc sp.]|uniref:hypothetical protein n=1 Tax=uncultured Nostoc sp. TaxID=340711 RepID=UPI0035CA8914
MTNSKQNRNPHAKLQNEEENSGVFINLRFPGRAIAIAFGMVVTFGAGVSIGNTQNLNQQQNLNQNNVDCSLRNSPTQPSVK